MKNTKVAIGLIAAAAMLALPALSQAQEIQRSHPEDAQTPQSQTIGGDSEKAKTLPHENKLSNSQPETSSKTFEPKSATNQSTSQTSFPSTWGSGTPATISVNHGTLTVHSPEGGTSDLDRSEFTRVAHSGNTPITKIQFIGGTTYLPQDSSGLFEGFNALTSITGLDKVDTSHVTDMNSMFYDCEKLTNLDLNHFDTSNVTDMNSMFKYCESLASIDLSHLDTGNVTDMHDMFESCEKLTSLDMRGLDTHSLTTMDSICWYCPGLKSVNMSGLDTSNVTDMAFMFMSCKNLESLDMSGIDNHNTGNYTTGIFDGCEHLRQLRIGAKTGLNGLVFNIDDLISPDDGYTGKWIQLPEPGTQSANVDPNTTYTSYELANRTMNDEADSAGTYVWQQRLTFKPSSDLPSGTSVADPASKTMLGGVATIEGAGGHDILLTSFKAPGSKYTLQGTHASDYRFAGWSDTDITGGQASGTVYQKDAQLNPEDIPGHTLYQIWTRNTPTPSPSPTPTPSPNPNPGMPSNPGAPSAPGRNTGLGTPTAPLMPGAMATAQALGGDRSLSSGNTAKPQARGHKTPKCEPVSYVEGTLIPASATCANDTTATVSKTVSTRHMPLWIFLLLAIITVAALAAIKRNDDFTVVQHRAAETER